MESVKYKYNIFYGSVEAFNGKYSLIKTRYGVSKVFKDEELVDIFDKRNIGYSPKEIKAEEKNS